MVISRVASTPNRVYLDRLVFTLLITPLLTTLEAPGRIEKMSLLGWRGEAHLHGLGFRVLECSRVRSAIKLVFPGF